MVSDAALEAVSGAFGSIVSLLLTYPLKTIYTLQALSAPDLNGQQDKNTALLSIVQIIQKYKLKGLYVGIEPNVFESGISSAAYFYLYSRLRSMFVKRDHEEGRGSRGSSKDSGSDLSVATSLLVAALAGAGNQLVTMPASVIATRMQAQAKLQMESNLGEARTGVLQVISSIWKESGISGFWAGLLPALVLVVNPAMQYMLYEQLLHLMRRKKQERILARQAQGALQMSADPDGELPGAASQSPQCLSLPLQRQPEPCKLSAGEIFIASALAKIGATVVTYPLIVVKSRRQAMSKALGSQHQGILQQIWNIFQDEGPGGFFKGLKAKILQTALNAALMLMLKDQCFDATKAVLAKRSSGGSILKTATNALSKQAPLVLSIR